MSEHNLTILINLFFKMKKADLLYTENRLSPII